MCEILTYHFHKDDLMLSLWLLLVLLVITLENHALIRCHDACALRRAKPTSPSSPEPNSHTEAGIGTAETSARTLSSPQLSSSMPCRPLAAKLNMIELLVCGKVKDRL